MNKDIIRMAREACWPEDAGIPDTGSMNLDLFADLIRADECEACAKIADGYIGGDTIADNIRARSNK